MEKRPYFCNVILFCLMFSLGVCGCAPAGIVPLSTITPALINSRNQPVAKTENVVIEKTTIPAIPIVSPTFTSLPLPTVTRTMMPTLDPVEEEHKIKTLLQIDQTCQLPCAIGINPGRSKWSEIEKSFIGMGLHWNKPYITTGSEGQIHEIIMEGLNSHIKLAISPFVIEDVIDGLLIGLTGPGILEAAPDYYINHIIQSLGIPSRVWLDSSYREGMLRPVFGFWVFYDEKGIAIHYYVIGLQEDNSIKLCPTDPNRFATEGIKTTGENIFIQDSDNPRNLEQLIEIWGQKISNLPQSIEGISGRSFEEVSGLTLGDYYRMISDDSDRGCFNTRIVHWGIN